MEVENSQAILHVKSWKLQYKMTIYFIPFYVNFQQTKLLQKLNKQNINEFGYSCFLSLEKLFNHTMMQKYTLI